MSRIEEEMFTMIESEIHSSDQEKFKKVNKKKAILVAERLVGLASKDKLPDNLVGDYIAIVETVCKQN